MVKHVYGTVALVAVLLLSACGGGDDGGTDEASASASDTAAAATDEAPTDDGAADETGTGDETGTDDAAADDGAFPRTVTDALGEVEIPTAPVRVVTLDQSLLDAAFVLDLEVVGYTTFADPDGPIPELYGDAAQTTDATWVGDLQAPNLEVIAQIQPDLILTSAVRHEAIRDQLAEIAPTVMTASAGAGWKDSIRLAGEATGKEEAAEAALTAYEERAAAVGEAIRAERGDPTVSVVRVVDVIRLYQPPSFSGVVLDDVGLSRPPSQQDSENFISVISPEEIAEADADVIVYATFDDPRAEESVTELTGGALWATLGAVQAGEVYAVEDDEWMSGVGLFGANAILDDLITIFGIDVP
ncbi:MAG: ABC transporter substrate-binding protein [Actinomycetota bacterium]